jgi:DNA polymerase III epsilon subunit-like protein
MIAALPTGKVVVVDTETGGLDSSRNPLLSVGLLVGKPDAILAVHVVHCAPPKDTWLEVPVHSDQLRGKYGKTVEYWLNLSTGEKIAPKDEKPACLITAVAAEINGFVKASDLTPGWDAADAAAWPGRPYQQAADDIAKFIAKHSPEAVVCHNASFDKSFIDNWLPELSNLFPAEWACTQTVYKNRFLSGKTKGSSLAALCKAAGYAQDPAQAHTARGDCLATYHAWKWLVSQQH